MKKTWALITAVILTLASIQPGLGAGVHLKTEIGFNGYVVPGTVAPLRVRLIGMLKDSRIEVINAGDGQSFSIIESFPVQNTKRIEASIFIREVDNNLKIRLISDGQILMSAGLNSEVKKFPGNMVLVVRVPAPVQQTIERALLPVEPVLVVPVNLEDLPATALNYDGISGLVLTDPGPALTPAQIKALKAWLAGGGHIVLSKTHTGKNSFLSQLGIKFDNKSENSYHRVGFGGINLIEGNSPGSGWNIQADNWRRLLDLKPYIESSRLMIKGIFPENQSTTGNTITEQPIKAKSHLSVVLMIWVTSTLALIILTKKRRIMVLFLHTIFWTALACFLGNWIAGAWLRGAEIQSRNVILPEAGRMLADVKIRFNRFNIQRIEGPQSSPWGANISLGRNESGMFQPDNRKKLFAWAHCFGLPQAMVRAAGPNWVNLVGWFPLDENGLSVISGRPPIRKAITNEIQRERVIWNGEHFYVYRFGISSNGHWKRTEKTPTWLVNESIWLSRLNQIKPGTPWMIGFDYLPVLGLKIGTGVYSKGLWALPLAEEVLK